MDQQSVGTMIDELKPLDQDNDPPLQINEIKKILCRIEKSIRTLQLNTIPPEEHQEIKNQINLITKTLSSEDLAGR